MPLSSASLDAIMKRLDADADGTVTRDEFSATFHELRARYHGCSWKSLAATLWKERKVDGANGRLDAAFQMSDVVGIRDIGLCHGGQTAVAADAEWERSTLAISIRGRAAPLAVTCTKPGHAEAWMEAFVQALQVSHRGCPKQPPLNGRIRIASWTDTWD